MSDLDVRTAAHKEAERKIKAIRQEVGFSDEDSAWWWQGFQDGAVWAAGRLPTRDEIAKVLAESNGTPWDVMSDDPSCVYLRDADAVLALITRHLET